MEGAHSGYLVEMRWEGNESVEGMGVVRGRGGVIVGGGVGERGAGEGKRNAFGAWGT